MVNISAHSDHSDISDLKTLSSKFSLPVVDAIQDEMLDAQLIKKIPVDWLRSRNILPVRYNGIPALLTAAPDKVEDLQDLEMLLSTELNMVLASPRLIQEGIEKSYTSRDQAARDFVNEISSLEDDLPKGISSAADLLESNEQAPISHFINLTLLDALKSGASDIHFEPFHKVMKIRYRIDGVLYEQASPPPAMHAALLSRLKVMGNMDISEKRLPQDGMTQVRIGDRQIDIRISSIPIADGERLVLRLLDRNRALLPLEDLGLSGHVLNALKNVLTSINGLVLVTGPTGSGKTTTLYAALRELNAQRRNILTIEDPVEYRLDNIGQIQVKPEIGLTFASGLRHILRQDPDIVLVGETRDSETAEIAVRSALTGHLVFTTLHTNDAPSAIIRAMDIGIEPYLLAASLRGVLAQRLVRRLCPHCREQADDSALNYLPVDYASRLAGKPHWRAKGCSHCLEGYSGRSGIFEFMTINAEIQQFIRQGSGELGACRKIALESGMKNLVDDGLARVLDGTTSLDELATVLGLFEVPDSF
jgi:general secretion pathway protein E